MLNHDGFETLAFTRARSQTRSPGAVVPPIYQVSTYKQDGVGGPARRLRVLPVRQPDQDRA